MSDDGTQRRCSNCHRWKDRHLWLLRQWVQKSPSKCKRCYKNSDGYLLTLSAKYQQAYDITLNDYEKLLKDQGGRCAICVKKPGRVRLAVDHDHALEKLVGTRRSIRGLLCRACNEYLAHIKDDAGVGGRLSRHIKYGAEAVKLFQLCNEKRV